MLVMASPELVITNRRSSSNNGSDSSSSISMETTSTRKLDDMPEDLLWMIVASVFAEQVLNAFDATYPRVKKFDSIRSFVDEMTETLMFRGIFSLLHVSNKFREITGRLLLRAVPTSSVETRTTDDGNIYIKAIYRLECSALLCIYISRNSTISDLLDSNFYRELVSRTEGLDLISSPLVQTYGFINRLRNYSESFAGISIRHALPECPVDLKKLEMDGYGVHKEMPSYYCEALRTAYTAHRETLAVISFIDLLKLWDEGIDRGIMNHEPDSFMEDRIHEFLARLNSRKELSRKFAQAMGKPSFASSPRQIKPSVSRQIEVTFKMQVLLLWDQVTSTGDITELWMMQLAFRLCREFECGFISMDGGEIVSREMDVNMSFV